MSENQNLNEFTPDPEKIPLRIAAYEKALAIYDKCVAFQKEKYRDDYGEDLADSEREVDVLYFFPSDEYFGPGSTSKDKYIQPIGLPSYGNDSMRLIHLEFHSEYENVDNAIDSNYGPEGKLPNRLDHHFLVMFVELFKDGEPHRVPGDKSSYELDTLIDDNQYFIILGRELPPSIIQCATLSGSGWITRDFLEKTSKHRLSDEDCASALQLFESNIASVDVTQLRSDILINRKNPPQD